MFDANDFEKVINAYSSDFKDANGTLLTLREIRIMQSITVNELFKVFC